MTDTKIGDILGGVAECIRELIVERDEARALRDGALDRQAELEAELFAARREIENLNGVVEGLRLILGDRWALRFKTEGAHVSVAFRAGTPGSRALLGTITVDREEAAALHAGAAALGAVCVGGWAPEISRETGNPDSEP